MSDKQVRAQYTREFKLEAVRQVRAGQAIAVVAKVLGIPKASLGNWVRLSSKGELNDVGRPTRRPKSRPSRWRLPGCAPRMLAFAWSATSQKKLRRTSRRTRCEVRLD